MTVAHESDLAYYIVATAKLNAFFFAFSTLIQCCSLRTLFTKNFSGYKKDRENIFVLHSIAPMTFRCLKKKNDFYGICEMDFCFVLCSNSLRLFLVSSFRTGVCKTKFTENSNCAIFCTTTTTTNNENMRYLTSVLDL